MEIPQPKYNVGQKVLVEIKNRIKEVVIYRISIYIYIDRYNIYYSFNEIGEILPESDILGTDLNDAERNAFNKMILFIQSIHT